MIFCDATVIAHLVVFLAVEGLDCHDVVRCLALFDKVPGVIKRSIAGFEFSCPVLEDGVASQRAKSVTLQTLIRLQIISLYFGPRFLKDCSPDRGAIDTRLREYKPRAHVIAFVCVEVYRSLM